MYLQLLCHLWGDYIFQTQWMADKKTKSYWVAGVHAFTYTIPFLLITHDIIALWMICYTHFVIDRHGLARYLVWFKNQIAPKEYRFPLSTSKFGFSAAVPDFLAVWLLIISDNTLHLTINAIVLYWRG